MTRNCVRVRNPTRLHSLISQLRFEWMRLAGIAVVATALVAGFVLSVRTSDLLSTLANLASNVLASVVVAVVAILAFQVL